MRSKAGDHVELKGFLLTGFTGTIISIGRLGTIRVKLDAGQVRAGNTIVRVRQSNIARKSAVHT